MTRVYALLIRFSKKYWEKYGTLYKRNLFIREHISGILESLITRFLLEAKDQILDNFVSLFIKSYYPILSRISGCFDCVNKKTRTDSIRLYMVSQLQKKKSSINMCIANKLHFCLANTATASICKRFLFWWQVYAGSSCGQFLCLFINVSDWAGFWQAMSWCASQYILDKPRRWWLEVEVAG